MGLPDQVLDDAVRFVDVLQGAMTQSMSITVIFFFFDVVSRRIEQFQGSMIAASAGHVVVDRRMVVQVFAVINRSLLDLCDSPVDLCDGVIFFPIHPASPRPSLQMGARMAKVGKGVQVGGMPSWFVGKSQRSADSNKKHDYCTMSNNLHSLLELAFRQNGTRCSNPELRF